MGVCRECRFWTRRTSDSTTFGWCRALADTKGDTGVFLLQVEWNDRTIGEKVFTREYFGCVQFEARED